MSSPLCVDEPLGLLLARYEPLAYRLAYGKIGVEPDSRDITQEVLSRIAVVGESFLKLDAIQQESFVQTTTRRQIANYLRYHRQACRDRRRTESCRDLAIRIAAKGPGLSTAFDLIQKRADVQTALGRLSSAEQAIVRMMYFEILKNVDIAAALGISVVTLARRHRRILAKLQGDLSLRKWTRPNRDPAEESNP